MATLLDPDTFMNVENRFNENNSSSLDTCISLIKEFEGYAKQLSNGNALAYQDSVGIWTIGWGSIRNFDDNIPIQEGNIITPETAERWLQNEVRQTAEIVEKLCAVKVTRSMFDALVSFGYNVGTGGGGLRTSTLLKKLNETDYEGAAKEFSRWIHGIINGQKVEISGLAKRRKIEADLFLRDGLLTKTLNVNPELISPSTDERQYSPAPVPLPFNRFLEIGATGEDCFVLNCALAGLGFLRVGSQPSQFTSVTEDAVKLFQHREKIQVNGQVGPTTKQALERTLQSVRVKPVSSSPDLVFCKLTRTHEDAYQGLEWCKLDFVDPQGQVLDSLKVVSGTPSAQKFNLPENSFAGSNEPIPQGRYGIADIEFAGGRDNYDVSWPSDGDGLGPVWVPIVKPRDMDKRTDRDAFGMHCDWNWFKSHGSPGSAGCVVVDTVDKLRELVRLLRKYDPRELVVYWGL